MAVVLALCALGMTPQTSAAQAMRGSTSVVGELPARDSLERHVGILVRYGDVRVPDGYRVRTISTRPIAARGPIPAIFVVGWLSCDPVTSPGVPSDGYARLISDLVERSGYAVVRVEKPGLGDSEGPRCEDADFSTDLEAYRAAWRQLAEDSGVDQRRKVVLGLSNGGAIAPLVTGTDAVAGYVTVGAWSKTWLEHMLELERRRMRLAGARPAAVSDSMRGYATFYDRYLNGRLAPGAVAVERPELARYWYDEPARQYGRPARFYHQLQALNIAAAWSEADAPVLAIWGEFDWIMSRDDVAALPGMVRPAHRPRSRFVELPRTDHVLNEYATAADAFGGRDGVPGVRATPLVLDWLERLWGGGPLQRDDVRAWNVTTERLSSIDFPPASPERLCGNGGCTWAVVAGERASIVGIMVSRMLSVHARRGVGLPAIEAVTAQGAAEYEWRLHAARDGRYQVVRRAVLREADVDTLFARLGRIPERR